MPNDQHLELLKKGRTEWNKWREENQQVTPDFSRTCLSGFNLSGGNFSKADFSETDLSGADLTAADLYEANLFKANLFGATLSRASLFGANLTEADLSYTSMFGTELINANMNNTILNNSAVYGISVWDIKGIIKEQNDLIITPLEPNLPKITVDNIKVAQFLYLFLENKEIRNAIDTFTSKGVLILGRFASKERKKILDKLKGLLRERNYLPILFDFEKPSNKDLTETVNTLAGLSKFVIADLTNPKSIPQELYSIVPHHRSVVVVPIVLESQKEYALYESIKRYPWVCNIYRYSSQKILFTNLDNEVIQPAEQLIESMRNI